MNKPQTKIALSITFINFIFFGYASTNPDEGDNQRNYQERKIGKGGSDLSHEKGKNKTPSILPGEKEKSIALPSHGLPRTIDLNKTIEWQRAIFYILAGNASRGFNLPAYAIQNYSDSLNLLDAIKNSTNINHVKIPVLISRGEVYYKNGLFAEALQDFRSVLALDPEMPNEKRFKLYLMCGETFFKNNQLLDSINYYSDAHSLPNITNYQTSAILAGRGLAYYKYKRFAEALQDFKTLLELRSEMPNEKRVQFYLMCGKILSQLNLVKEATQYFQEAHILSKK